MKETLYLAWRYVAFHRFKIAILVMSMTLIVFMPVALNLLVGQSAAELTARAERTPLIAGAPGSELELVLNSLSFSSEPPTVSSYAEAARIGASDLALPIPLYVRFTARGHPIVGTSLEYFEFRNLRLASGRQMALLGECVIGAGVAESLELEPGDTVVSSPESVFDLAGVYPLKMNVVGVLERSHTPDDEAVFVDLKTAWIIQGLGHGHQDLAAPEAASSVLKRTDDTITANASVVQYNEITPDNVDTFHFHGDLSGYPVTAVLAVPIDQKSGVILMGRYEDSESSAQIVRPEAVMQDLLDTVFTVRGFIVAAILLVGVATAATAALVFILSLRLRQRELATIVKIGGSRATVATLIASEVTFVIISSVALAGILSWLTSRFGAAAIQAFLLGQ